MFSDLMNNLGCIKHDDDLPEKESRVNASAPSLNKQFTLWHEGCPRKNALSKLDCDCPRGPGVTADHNTRDGSLHPDKLS